MAASTLKKLAGTQLPNSSQPETASQRASPEVLDPRLGTQCEERKENDSCLRGGGEVVREGDIYHPSLVQTVQKSLIVPTHRDKASLPPRAPPKWIK